jgi:hypothetical protein
VEEVVRVGSAVGCSGVTGVYVGRRVPTGAGVRVGGEPQAAKIRLAIRMNRVDKVRPDRFGLRIRVPLCVWDGQVP